MLSPKRILFLSMQYGEGYFQGTERYLQRLISGLNERGHETRVLAGDPLQIDPPATPNLITIPTGGWMSVEGIAQQQIEQQISAFRPDVIHLLNPAHIGISGAHIAQKHSIPYIVTTMDFWWTCPTHTLLRDDGSICEGNKPWQECARCIAARSDSLPARVVTRLPVLDTAASGIALMTKAAASGMQSDERSRWKNRSTLLASTLRGAHAVVFPSAATEQLIGEQYSGIPGVRIPYGVEQDWFELSRAPRTDVDPSTLRIGYAGAFAPHKGVHHLLEAVAQLRWTKSKIMLAGAGDAAYADQLRQLASGLDVSFLGRLDTAGMRAFFASIDLLVVPSIWPENLPIITLEAAASGTPVIASRIAGLSETMEDDAMFTPASSASLASCLEHWIGAGKLPPCPQRPITADEMIERTIRVYDAASH